MNVDKIKVSGQWCIVMERGKNYTKVLTPMRDIIEVNNNDIEEGQ